jgi:glycosyltransferase involved in cell wall biosynthesis
VARLYQVADVYAHAATREPFGIVFLEAMASGLPLVGHPWDVTRWILGEAGETVDMTVPGALREVLGRWRERPEERAVLAARARRRAVDQFSAASLVPKYLAMYERMAADR